MPDVAKPCTRAWTPAKIGAVNDVPPDVLKAKTLNQLAPAPIHGFSLPSAIHAEGRLDRSWREL
jgi:hypothetical protein